MKQRNVRLDIPTSDLRASVEPDELEDVLSSLKFRRIITSYVIDQDLTRVVMSRARGVSLLELLQAARREEG